MSRRNFRKPAVKRQPSEVAVKGGPVGSPPIRGTRPMATPWTSWAAFLVLSVLLILGISLRLAHRDDIRSRSPDENTYRNEAMVLSDKGIDGIRQLLVEYNSNEKNWKYPHPLRLGYLWPLAAVMKVTGQTDIGTGAGVSCFFSILTLFLVVWVGVKFFNPWIASVALLLIAVSPMSLAVSLRNWQEAMIEFFGLLLIYFCCEINRNSQNRLWYALLVIFGSYFILIKETCSIFYFFCVLWVLGILFLRDKSWGRGGLFFVAAAAGAGLSLGFLCYVAGGFSAVLEPMKHMRQAAEFSAYAKEFCSGQWYEFFGLIFSVSPLSSFLCLLGIGKTLVWKKSTGPWQRAAYPKDRMAAWTISFITLGYLIIILFHTSLSLNLRYCSVIYGPMDLLAGLGAWTIFDQVSGERDKDFFPVVVLGLGLALLVSATMDYQRFKKIFIQYGIKDLTIGLIRNAQDLKIKNKY